MPETTACQTVVCPIDDLDDPDSRGLTLCLGDNLHDVFIVRQGRQVFAYYNSCPHAGGPLDWLPEQFLDIDKQFIQCATHGALFQINDGRCVAGPCLGDRLVSVPVTIVDGEIVIVHSELSVNGS